MRRFVDLHTHSTASDGACRPEEIVRLAEARRLAAVALTDHDTVAGLPAAAEAARETPSLRFIPGVELSAKFAGGTLHILGLGIEPSCPALRETMRGLVKARRERNPKIIARLRAIGIDISMEDVLAAAGQVGSAAEESIIGRLHIAEALRRKGCVRNIDEAFSGFLGDRGAAFVDKEHLAPRQAIAAIRDAGGLAVLAHPPQLNYRNRAQLETILRGLIGAGLNGIEVYHTDHSPQQTRLFLDLARRLDLCVTGGSDFHGAAKPEAHLGRPRVPASAVALQPQGARLLT